VAINTKPKTTQRWNFIIYKDTDSSSYIEDKVNVEVICDDPKHFDSKIVNENKSTMQLLYALHLFFPTNFPP
jgi:hypothetical protein